MIRVDHLVKTFGEVEAVRDISFDAPVPRLLIMVGRTLGGAPVAIVQGLIVVVICLIAGFCITTFRALPMSLLYMILIAVMFTAMSTAIASVLSDFQGFQLIINFLVMPMFFLSGALFPLTNLPLVLNVLTIINPLSYGVDGLRDSFIGVSHFGVATDLAVLSVMTAILLVVGARLFSRIQM